MKRQQWAVLFLIGLLLCVTVLPVSNTDNAADSAQKESSAASLELSEGSTEKSTLEERLEQILADVQGVGDVQVMLMTEEESGGFSSSENLKVTGVLIAAQGADNPVTVQNIKEAVMALFQVEAHKIKIMKMKS
jgi:stage III sporulation protein AG